MTDLEAYARRIDYAGPLEPTIDVLRDIVWRHQLAIPFENLDIYLLKRPVSLQPEAIFAKLVGAARGGFCFEQNGLLASVLAEIGFGVTYGYATWQTATGDRVVPFDHQVLRVETPEAAGAWLADVGFGRDNPGGPLPLVDGAEIEIPRPGIGYRIRRLDDPDLQWSVEQRPRDRGWRPLYDLDLRPRRIDEFEARNQANQHSPESHFTQGVICSRPIEDGRITVTTDTLILTQGAERQETPLPDRGSLLHALGDWFGIWIDETELRMSSISDDCHNRRPMARAENS